MQFNQIFKKQIDDCKIGGGPLSVILPDIHMGTTENEVVIPMNSPFYKRFLVEIHFKRNKFQKGILFKALNDFHP